MNKVNFMNDKEIEEKTRLIVDELKSDYYYGGPLYFQSDVMSACKQMAEWMHKKMYWKARKAFCKATCGECPLNTDDIEGCGGLAVRCDKLESFDKILNAD